MQYRQHRAADDLAQGRAGGGRVRPQSFHQTARKLDRKRDFDISDRKRMLELLSLLEIAIGLTFGDGAALGKALGSRGKRSRSAQQGASPIEPLGLLSIRGTGHTTYKYVYLCHKSRTFSSPLTLPPIANGSVKFKVIFCVQAVISPLLANIYLHYAFDLWVEAWRKKYAQGDVIVIRFADDTVLGFQHQAEADRFLQDLGERLGKFGLELHPDKTRRIEFGRYAETNRKGRGEGQPETFDFLGFSVLQKCTDKEGNMA
jgi:hypothetical protein